MPSPITTTHTLLSQHITSSTAPTMKARALILICSVILYDFGTHLRGYLFATPCCAFVLFRYHSTYRHLRHQHSIHAQADAPREEQTSSDGQSRKPPLFPGAIPIDSSADIATFIHQTNQPSPANALLGKPSTCNCRHGFPQAYSLNPMPMSPCQESSKQRLNSGLLKLTCPLLVTSVDLLEDEGFMKNINLRLTDTTKNEEWIACMNDAHRIHAITRKELIFEERKANWEDADAANKKFDQDGARSNDAYQTLKDKLGVNGAEFFLDSGVAGVNPLSTNADVKCLHAWLADYLFREQVCSGVDGEITKHPIGEAIVDELVHRGVDIRGTETCNSVCSGIFRANSNSGEENSTIAVSIPVPRNRQRKRSGKEVERRKRRRHEDREE